MKEHHIIEKLAGLIRKGMGAARRWASRAASAMKALGRRVGAARVGWYLSLATLLTILGVASHGYRVRLTARNPMPTQTPMAAMAYQTPAPTPMPTHEPPALEWPVTGEVVTPFMADEPRWSEDLEMWETHPAVDISAVPGEAVRACGAGVVEDAWQDPLWGNVIVIRQDDGCTTTYANLNTLNLVEAGERVAKGQVISAVGQSAACEAELPWHLHLELKKDGESVDFAAIMAETGE